MTRRVNFDLLAHPYRWLEYLTFGPLLSRTRLQFLPRLLAARRALVLGDGDGRFLATLVAANPDIVVDAIDSSQRMLSLAARRVRHAGAAARVTFHHADLNIFLPPVPPSRRDASAYEPQAAYDLLVTHFFLDCFTTEQLQTLLPGLARCLRPGALWVISDFNIPATRPLAARLLVAALYRAFGLLTGLAVRSLPEYPPLLRRLGFVLLERRSRLAGLLTSELWALPPDRAADR